MTFRYVGGESDQGGRRHPKTKYEIGRTPAKPGVAGPCRVSQSGSKAIL